MLSTEGNLRPKIDWPSLILGRKFTVFLCFTLHLRAVSQFKPPGRLYFEGRFNEFGGPIFGGAYTWRGLFSGFYGIFAQDLPIPTVF